jgi:tetratricopeptide (TPR) repeat protein
MKQSWMLGLILLGAMNFARAESEQTIPDDTDTSPYHEALFDYKSGKYEEAQAAINVAEKARPGDPATEILKARILTETSDFAGAKAALEGLNGNPALTPELSDMRTMAFGDMCLRKRSYDEATKFYESLLARKPGDPDLTLKIVYARIGASDLVGAGQTASHLTPMDPKNPYDDHASYYFARAALARATGKSAEEEEDIQTARTIYGISVANRYLKTYLEVFSTPKPASSGPAPAPSGKAAPSGAN